MIDGLTTRVKAWEKERGVPFLCDKVTICTFTQLSFLCFDSAYVNYAFSIQHPMLQTLEEEIVLRAQREEEKRQFRVRVLIKTRICRQSLWSWTNKTKLFVLFCVNRSSNGYKVSLLQRKKQSMVQNLQRRSHWDRVLTQTMWQKHHLVVGLGLHLEGLVSKIIEKAEEAMPQRYRWTMSLFRKKIDW